MSELIPVTYDQLFFYWKEAAPILKRAVDKNDGYNMHDVLEALLLRQMQLWLSVENGVIEAVGVTMLQNYPQKRTCLLLFVAGKDFEHWRDFLPEIEKWASFNGCKDLEFIGRPGWKKYYPETDTVYRIIIKKDHKNEQGRRR